MSSPVVTMAAIIGGWKTPLSILAPARGGDSASFAPVPYGEILQSGTMGTAYSEALSVAGGSAPYAFALMAGSLPAGLALNSSTGIISGIPTAAAVSTFVVQAKDVNGNAGSTQCQISVIAASGGAAAANYGFIG